MHSYLKFKFQKFEIGQFSFLKRTVFHLEITVPMKWPVHLHFWVTGSQEPPLKHRLSSQISSKLDFGCPPPIGMKAMAAALVDPPLPKVLLVTELEFWANLSLCFVSCRTCIHRKKKLHTVGVFWDSVRCLRIEKYW